MTDLEAVTAFEAKLSKLLADGLAATEALLINAGATPAELEEGVTRHKALMLEAYQVNVREFLRLLHEPDAPSLSLQ